MSKQGGSLERGRRRRDEVPAIPQDSRLNDVQRAAQASLVHLVERAGGRFEANSAIPISNVDVLAELFDEWGRTNAELRDGRLYFTGRPGLWHALDELCPLQDPNRWDNLRRAIILELETRGWQRTSPPRGTAFLLPD